MALCEGTFDLNDLVKLERHTQTPTTKGETVELNSGGPRMEIIEVNGETAVCEWIQDGEITGAIFPLVCLNVLN